MQIERNYSPPQLAKLWNVGVSKVRGWIESGELIAANLGDGTRPRWRISDTEKDRFWAARQNYSASSNHRHSAVEANAREYV